VKLVTNVLLAISVSFGMEENLVALAAQMIAIHVTQMAFVVNAKSDSLLITTLIAQLVLTIVFPAKTSLAHYAYPHSIYSTTLVNHVHTIAKYVMLIAVRFVTKGIILTQTRIAVWNVLKTVPPALEVLHA
jgi:hypothetical protein